jgi:hypothetical protein
MLSHHGFREGLDETDDPDGKIKQAISQVIAFPSFIC